MNSELNRQRYARVEDLRRLTEDVFNALGVTPKAATSIARNLVHADLRGHAAHGVTRISIYAERIERGVVEARPDIHLQRTRPSVSLVDGGNGPGAYVGDRAMAVALEHARETGIGLAPVRRTNHNGPGSYFALQAVPCGFIGISATNPAVSMAAWGGRGRALGTNPITVAVPARARDPVVLDMSSSVVARGKIIEAAKRGESIPEGWALDTEGRPTTDARAAEDGVVLPFGGPKGSAIAIIVDILAGVLSGAAFGKLVGNLYSDFETPQNNGHFVAALDVSACMPPERFGARMEQLIAMLKETPPADGFDEILMPGEPEARAERERRRTGVPLPDNVIADLEAVAKRTGVAMPPLYTAPLAG